MQHQNIEEAVIDFAQRIKDPIAVKNLDLERTKHQESSPQIVWNDFSLACGYPGILILCALLEKKGIFSEGIAHRYVLEIKKALENQGTHDLSLVSGFTGICFAIEEASFGKTRYKSLLNTLQSHLLNRVKDQFLSPLKENLKKGIPSSPFLYDPISGICGIGRYALENLDSSPFLELSQEIAKILIQLTFPISIGNHRVSGWYVPPTNRINQDRFDKQHPNGNFNLGLAHGATGILSYLAIAYLKGLRVERQLEAIHRLSDWIKSKAFIKEESTHWPYAVSLEEELSNQQTDHKIIKAGWCYGVPGIARTLYLAGQALNDPTLKLFSMDAMIQLLSRPPETWRLPGPCLCHGIAGLLTITEAMSKENEGQQLQSKIPELQSLLMQHYNKETTWGFIDVEAAVDHTGTTHHYKYHKVGLLEGSTGVILSLLSPLDKVSQWHLPLMIYA